MAPGAWSARRGCACGSRAVSSGGRGEGGWREGAGEGLAAGLSWRVFRFGKVFHVIAWKSCRNRKSIRKIA